MDEKLKRLTELLAQARRLHFEARQLVMELNRICRELEPFIQKSPKSKKFNLR